MSRLVLGSGNRRLNLARLGAFYVMGTNGGHDLEVGVATLNFDINVSGHGQESLVEFRVRSSAQVGTINIVTCT
jgi:hypothetical protein